MIQDPGNHTEETKRRPRQGAVLIIVLWIALGLAGTALLFGHSMMLDYRAADNTVAGIQAQQAIEGAHRYVLFVLSDLEEKGMMPDVDTYECDGVPVDDSFFWFVGRGVAGYRDNTPVFSLIDEASKLNLNTASAEMLEGLPRMTSELAAAIVDWRDSDSDVSPNGAESEAYMLRNFEYECKNAPFETVEELRLVAGAEWELLYGEDLNRNGVVDPNEDDGEITMPSDNRNGILDPGILDYVTVYSREPNTDSEGSSRINITNTEGDELNSLLQETFGQERATQIQQRMNMGEGELGSVLEFFVRTEMTLEEAAEIADRITASDDEYLEGLINVNTASETVLACVPGIGSEFASQLISYREGKTDELESVAWVNEILDDENAIQAGPYLTARSFQFRADIAAVGRGGRGFRRNVLVFDISGEEPIVVYRRDLSHLGWALGAEVRNELTSVTRQQW